MFLYLFIPIFGYIESRMYVTDDEAHGLALGIVHEFNPVSGCVLVFCSGVMRCKLIF
jgi:hypothetical protein